MGSNNKQYYLLFKLTFGNEIIWIWTVYILRESRAPIYHNDLWHLAGYDDTVM